MNKINDYLILFAFLFSMGGAVRFPSNWTSITAGILFVMLLANNMVE